MATTALVSTMGPVLIGGFVSSALYGVTSMQSYNYFQTFGSTDKWGLKSLVTFIWLLETLHAFLICVPIFRWLILDVDDPAALERTEIVDNVTVGNTSLIILTVHCFYARRLWILSNKNKLLVGIVLSIAFCSFGFEIVAMAFTMKFLQITEWHGSRQYFIVALSTTAVNDIIISVAMVYLLMGRKDSVKSTNALLTRIIRYIVTTGILTSLVVIFILICIVAMPNLVYLGIYNSINNVYANSLLAMLNARESLREIRPGMSFSISHNFQLSQLHFTASENVTEQGSGNLTKVLGTSNEAVTEAEITV